MTPSRHVDIDVDVDVAVVGGGPAGSAAAVALARAGRSVVLLDRARFPRDKTCGDGLTAAALRHLERLGLRPQALPSWQPVDGVWLSSPGGRAVRFPLPRDGVFAATVRRRELDSALLDLARDAGVDVRDGHGVRGAAASATSVALDVEGVGTVRAAHVVGADGMWSPLRKLLGIGEEGYRGDWHAFRQYVRTSGPAATEMWVWFERDLLPGYAWSFPLAGGRANVGFGVPRDDRRPTGSMKQLWHDLLDRPHVRRVLGGDAQPEAPHTTWPIPARVDRTTLVAGRTLFVGDAARAVDPLTGEGIAQALVTARLAAEAIVDAGALGPAAVAARYQRDVRAALVADHRMATLLGRVVSRPNGAEQSLRIAGSTAWTRRNFARWLFEDYPRAALVTPRRWAAMRARPGAYADR